uniref:Uncharacterized protein n=1 Tax=Thermorudis peleae TaxID=1382356 RepID=A0A831TIT8_9BACT
MRPSLRRFYRIATLLWPVELTLRACGLRLGAQHGNVRGARDQFRALRCGLEYYAILTATTARDGGDQA